jgi:hypothetical protein
MEETYSMMTVSQMPTTPISLSHSNATITIILTQTVEHISYLE